MVISAGTPTLTICEDNKEAFYESLNFLVRSTPGNDKQILHLDFNARVGSDNESWKGVLGAHGPWKMKRNGLLLLMMCAENNISITNTLFRLTNKSRPHGWTTDPNSGT